MNEFLSGAKLWLYKLSGEDYTIIQKCNKNIKLYFTLIGLLVFLILLSSFFSAYYFADNLFANGLIGLAVAILFCYVLATMYVLLLYTVTPVLLPSKSNLKNKRSSVFIKFSLSMFVRIFIVILLAIVIAQPLNILFLNPNSTAFASDINYYFRKSPFMTINTLLYVILFLLPIFLKYKIRELGQFYSLKTEIEKQLIEDEYHFFKLRYIEILESNITRFNKVILNSLAPYLKSLQKVNPRAYEKYFIQIQNEVVAENIEKYEYWADPPYRTITKLKLRASFSETDLLKSIYPTID